MNIHTCVVYKNMENSEVLELFSRLIGEEYPAYEAGELTDSDLEYERESYCKAVNMLLEMAANYGFSGNLWHTYLTWLLVNSENAFSKSCEIVGPVEGSINDMACHDFSLFKAWFDYDIRKLDEGQYCALVLAAAGLKRLGLEHRIHRYFSTEEILPAAGQAILAVQARKETDSSVLKTFHDEDAACCALAERAFVRQLDGGCTSPVAAFAQVEGDGLTLTGLYVSPDETVVRRGILRGEKTNAEKLGADLARRLKGE